MKRPDPSEDTMISSENVTRLALKVKPTSGTEKRVRPRSIVFLSPYLSAK